MTSVHIFIGPRKTGTSWLHHTVYGDSKVKEIRYPLRIGRRYVFQRYVAGQSLLIWPYLIHEPGVLDVLIRDIEQDGRQVSLYWSIRDEDSWLSSMTKFLMKYGVNQTDAQRRAKEELAACKIALARLEKTRQIMKLKIIDATDADLEILANACNTSFEALSEARSTRVYETDEVSRIPSEMLVNIFFRLKPFLPNPLLGITKLDALRNVFFRKNVKPKDKVS